MNNEGSIRPANSYTMTLDKDAADYLTGFTEMVSLKGTWQKSAEVRECYKWCEQNLGAKYKDWFMYKDSIHFKDTKRATIFRLTWSHLIT
jgi:hypothetical protein